MIKYIKLIFQGMGIGSLILVILSMFGIYFIGNNFSELLINNFIIYSIAAMIIGIGFNLPSIVYENNNLTGLTQFSVHMGIGMIVYIATALYVGWIPIIKGLGAIIMSIIIAFVFAICIWGVFYLYHKKDASDINKKIRKIQNKQ